MPSTPDPHSMRKHLDALADSTSPRDAASGGNLLSQIGRYRILELLGEGGMGTVYLAEQREPVRRRVALKIIKLGMDSKQVLARFEAERQALAMMNHDNIAKILDAGATDQGQPYFVMEHVPGLPITDYCNRNRLRTDDRLALFQQVCSGVQHAHQKGVIHRDLKPTNVLVTNEQGKPVPKIIDFGLAKATDHRLVEATLFTERGAAIGTPEYMSPEQAEPSCEDIDMRTDIYSLGVVLYELLVGALPFPSAELRRAGLLEIQRTIREVDPLTPSARLSSMASELPQIAEQRRTSTAALVRSVRGDLDWVVMRALEKDPSRRYPTPTALAEDVQRSRDDEPVQAGPPSARYRILKFARKHRVQLTAGALIVASLIAGLFGAWQMHVNRTISEARDRELTAHAEAQASSAESNLRYADLLAQRGQWLNALAAYERASAAGYPDQTEIDLGRVEALEGAGRLDEAVRALHGLTSANNPTHRAKILLLRGDLGVNRREDPDEGLELVQQAIDTGELDPTDASYAEALLAPRLPETRDKLLAALNLSPFHRRANELLGPVLLSLGRIEEALEFSRRVRLLYPDAAWPRALEVAALVLNRDLRAAETAQQELARMAPDWAVRTVNIWYKKLIRVHFTKRQLLKDSLTGELDSGLDIVFPVAIHPFTGAMELSFGIPHWMEWRLAPPLARAYQLPKAIAGKLNALAPASTQDIEEALSAFLSDHDDAIALFVRGQIRVGERRWKEAEADFQRAADAPSMLALERTALCAALWVQLKQLETTPSEHRAALSDRAVANARSIQALGRIATTPGRTMTCDELDTIFRERTEATISESWEPASELESARRKLLFDVAMTAEDHLLAESLCLQWRDESPNDSDVRVMLAEVSLALGWPERARQMASEIVQDEHTEYYDAARSIRNRSLENAARLREQSAK